MKHALIKLNDGSIRCMGVHPAAMERDGVRHKRVRQRVEATDITLGFEDVTTLTFPVADYDRGIYPDGWTAIYPDIDAEIAKWPAAEQAEVASWREVPHEGLPWLPGKREYDKEFRGAWRDVTPEPVVDIDMPAAREIRKAVFRRMRAPKLAALDADYMKALEADNRAAMTTIAAQKQALRDVTKDPAIDAAMTPAELKAVLPAVLAAR